MTAVLPTGVRVYLCTKPVDMRKSFDGLIAATKTLIGQDPLSGHLFVFVNRRADYAKCLYWARGGYCLWAKRLESGRFAKVVSESSTHVVAMTDTQWMMWLDGIELDRLRQHKRFVLERQPMQDRKWPDRGDGAQRI